MEIRPRQLAVAGAIAAAGFLGVGALTAASAQDSGDDSTTTTVEEQPGTDDGTTADQPHDDGTSTDARSDEDCPHDGQGRDGRGGRPGHRGDGDGQQEEEGDTAS
jgi:hypothetical protein